MRTRKLVEECKSDLALVQALNNSNVTSKYFGMGLFNRAKAILLVDTMAITKTAVLQLVEAKDVDGTDAQNLTGALATITANTNVIAATIALAATGAGDIVKVTGIIGGAATEKTYVQGTDFTTAADLAAAINADFETIEASVSTTTVAVQAVDGQSDVTIAATNVGGTVTVATTKAQAIVEIQAADLSDDYSHIAVKVTDTSNSTIAAVLERGSERYTQDNIGEETSL